MDAIEKLLVALRLNKKDFNEEEIRANSWRIFTNPAMATEIEEMYAEAVKIENERKENERKKLLRENIERKRFF